MPFEFVCPYCHNKTKVLDRYAGQTGPCVGCGKQVTMPHFNEQGVLIPSIHTPAKSKSNPKKAGSQITALLGAAVVVSVLLLSAIGLWVLWPQIQKGIRHTAQSKDLQNMRTIAIALNEYADRHGTYPPPAVLDAAGKPLYSWRVLILPFLGYEDLYREFDLNQPWDSPANSNLFRKMPQEFASPNSPDALSSFEANYVLLTGPGTLFPASGPLSGKNVDDPTILLVETTNSLTWSAPGDIDIARGIQVGNRSNVDMGGLHSDSFTAVSTEGKGMRMPEDVPQSVLSALITPNGGEKVQTDTFME